MPRRRAAALTAALSALSCSFVALVAAPADASPAPSPADRAVALSFDTFGDLAVDNTHQRVFVTGGPGSNGIAVRSFDGSAVSTVGNEPGADGLVISPDRNTLYVALADDSAVAAINLTTLHQTARYSIPADTCPTTLALSGDALLYGGSCDGQTSTGIGEIDLGVSHPAAQSVLPDADGTLLAASPKLPGVLFAASAGGSAVARYTVSGSTASLTRSVTTGAGLADLTVSPDGYDLLAAAHDNHSAADYGTHRLAYYGHYGNELTGPDAVAVSRDDDVAVGVDDPSTPNLHIYSAGGRQLRTIDVSQHHSFAPAPGGLAFDKTGDRLFAVTESAGASDNIVLHVLDHPAARDTTLTARAARVQRGKVVLAGLLRSGTSGIAHQSISITRHDASGTKHLHNVTTSRSGVIALTDRPSVGGPVTYSLSFDGTSRYEASADDVSVNVPRATTTLRLNAADKTLRYGQPARLRLHLGKTFDGRTVAVVATPVHAAPQKVGTVHVNRHGDGTISSRVTTRTTFTAVFPGDSRYAPKAASTTVSVAAELVSRLGKSDGHEGKYGLYSHRRGAPLTVRVLPAKPGSCVTFTVQRQVGSHWRQVSSSCATLNGNSVATGVAKGRTGTHYRVQADFDGDRANTAADTAWYYVQFT